MKAGPRKGISFVTIPFLESFDKAASAESLVLTSVWVIDATKGIFMSYFIPIAVNRFWS